MSIGISQNDEDRWQVRFTRGQIRGYWVAEEKPVCELDCDPHPEVLALLQSTFGNQLVPGVQPPRVVGRDARDPRGLGKLAEGFAEADDLQRHLSAA